MLFRVGGVGSLVNFIIIEVDGVESEVNLAVNDVIWVLFEQVELFLDPSGLEVVKVLFVLGLIFLVPLESHIDFFALLDLLYEFGQICGWLGLFYIFDFINLV